jgi:type IX secretion system PorP/SprF family membrane protein
MLFMIRRYAVFVCLFVLVGTATKAQQHPQYSLFSYNTAVYNPGMVGLDDFFSVTAHGRYQWTGIEGSPTSQNLSAQLPLFPVKSDVGLIVVNNQQGLQRNTEASLQFNYRIWQRKTTWAIGVQAGILQSALNGAKIVTPDGNYEGGNINHNDPILSEGWTDAIQPTFAAGIGMTSKHFTGGISALYLNEPKLALTQGSNGPTVKRNFFSHLTYNFKVKRNVRVLPSIMLKYDLQDLQQEANVVLDHSRLGWIGLGYRGFTETSQDAAYAMIGVRISKKLVAAYSYDYTLSGLKSASDGSHEVLIRYESPLTGVARPGKIIYTPRF